MRPVEIEMQKAILNKAYAIRQHLIAISHARDLLQINGQPEEYYTWHERTIELNEQAIKKIRADPETSWN